MPRASSFAALFLVLAACAPDEPAPPPASPVRERTDAVRERAGEAERAMQESAGRAQAAADSAR